MNKTPTSGDKDNVNRVDLRAGTSARHLPTSIGWSVRYSIGPAGPFHQLTPSPRFGSPQTANDAQLPTAPVYDHQIWVHQVDRTAVVLGSTQRLDGPPTESSAQGSNENRPGLVLRDSRGQPVELCSRRSGGGLVVVDPIDTVWVDVVVPSWSPLHQSDIAKAFLWCGELWADVLRASIDGDGHQIGIENSNQHRTAIAAAPLPTVQLAEPRPGRRVSERPFFCFDGIGHGEVLVSGNKVVGISQRRTRHWSRLQSLVALRWNAAAINDLLAPIKRLPELNRLGRAPYDASDVAAGLDPAFPVPERADLIRRFVAQLPPVGGG